MATELKGKTLKRNSGDHPDVNADEALKGGTPKREILEDKVVALYFSAHWCPPCRAFTPILKDFYNEVAKEGLEIVFLSSDENELALKEYLAEAHGEWLYLPFGDPAIKSLSEKLKVEGIPTLVILKPDGSVYIPDATDDVQDGGPAKFAEWKAACGL